MSTVQRLRLVFVLVFLLGLAWVGLKEGLDGMAEAETDGQRIAAGFQLLYGLATLPCMMALAGRPSWARPALGLWAVALTVTGTLAPVVWGGTSWGIGLLSGALTLAVAVLICWGAFAHLRGASATPPGPSGR